LDYLERLQIPDGDMDKTKEIIEKLQWIREKEVFVRELNQILNIINKVFKLVKSRGICKETILKCHQYIDGLKSVKGEIIKQEIQLYLNEVITTVKEEKVILCTSDIIESTFGMFKNNISKNALNGITNLSLCMPASTNKIEPDEIKRIMEGVELKMVHKWTAEYIGKGILQQRKKAFNNKYGVQNKLKKAA
jgi:hypothetical protein